MRSENFLGMLLIGAVIFAPFGGIVAGERLPVSAASVKQKLAYSNKLLNKGAIAKAIIDSNDAVAIERLEKSKSLLKQATQDAGAGRLSQADKRINRALALVRSAMPKLGSEEAKRQRRLKTYNSRRESVLAFLRAYDRIAREKQLGASAGTISRQVKARVAKSDNLVEAGELEKGRREIEKAYILVTTVTAQLRQGDTLVRELKFDTPRDEYIYEIDRNDSLVSVLEMTLAEKKPAPRFLSKIESLRAESETIRMAAEKQARAGEFKKAIKTLGKSAKSLVRAIRMGGLFIPG